MGITAASGYHVVSYKVFPYLDNILIGFARYIVLCFHVFIFMYLFWYLTLHIQKPIEYR